MEGFISNLKKGTKLTIRGEEYFIETKTWYSIEEDETASYIKCELSNNKVLVVIPIDELVYIGEIIKEMQYKRLSEEKIEYKDIIFCKTGEGHQFIKYIEYGEKDKVEGKCIFEDYEAENNIISLGILPDRQNERADVFADILGIEEILY